MAAAERRQENITAGEGKPILAKLFTACAQKLPAPRTIRPWQANFITPDCDLRHTPMFLHGLQSLKVTLRR